MNILPFFIYLMATWRVSSLFVNEKGPLDIFLRIRRSAGIEHDEDGNKTIIPERFLAGVLSCVWCASLWVGAFWVALDWFLPDLALRIGMVFAVSAGAIWLEKKIG